MSLSPPWDYARPTAQSTHPSVGVKEILETPADRFLARNLAWLSGLNSEGCGLGEGSNGIPGWRSHDSLVCEELAYRLQVGRSDDALFRDDRIHQMGWRDIEGGVSNRDAIGNELAVGHMRHFAARAVLNGDIRTG